jgi:ribose/xylose/arabinose/galactoside ABC-type transport system permease subunit
MTYADSGQGFRDESRFRSEPGFREETGLRSDTGRTPAYHTSSYPVAHYPTEPDQTTVAAPRQSAGVGTLDNVFDNPEHGEPGTDRMLVHVIWELLLLLGCVAVFILFRDDQRAGSSGSALRDLLLYAASLGFVTVGMALSLRAGVVNLAVGPIAAGSAIFFAGHSDRNMVATIGVCMLLAAAVGVAVAILTVGFHVPAWAASLAGAFAVVVWIQKHGSAIDNVATYQPASRAYYWFGAFAALSLLGGLLGLAKPIRRGVGRFRSLGDPALRRGGSAGVTAFLVLVASSALAGLGGALAGLSSDSVTPTDGLVTTGLALGAALVGGTSAFGRRGGVFGTLFAVALLALLVRYGEAANLRVAQYAWAAGAIALGLVVTRLVESLGRPRLEANEDEEAEAWPPRASQTSSAAQTTGWSNTPRQGGWSSQLSARSLDDTWAGDDRWGSS